MAAVSMMFLNPLAAPRRLLVFVVLWSVAVAGASGEPFSKGPYIQASAPGTMTIMWEGLSNRAGTVRFGPGNLLNEELTPVLPREMKSLSNTSDSGPTKASKTNIFYLYEATLRNLKPGAMYSYSVELNGIRSQPRQFRMLDSAAESVRFIAYGDSRSDPKVHAALTKNFVQHSPEFILHTGDLVARGEDYNLWSREFFTPTAEIIDHVPLFSVIGNHEHDGTNYLNYFELPGNELWYSFDAGPVHVLALDFRSEKASKEQFKFARRDLLDSRAAWKIVVVHTPLFNIGGHASGWGHTDYLPLFHKAKVDLVLAGHSHMYERFRPLAQKSKANKWVITHITTGGGGANLHAALNHPALLVTETTNHFMVFDATRDRLQAKAIRVDGLVLDSFELKKTKGRPEPAYVAQAYPEEYMDLFYEVAPELAGRVVALPGTNGPAEVMLTILPRKKNSPSAELEITLAPQSAATYELVDSPLRVSTPQRGQTNVVWATVRARDGAKVTKNSSSELAPALRFQAVVKAADGETIAYGAASKLSKTAQEAANKRLATVGQ